MLFLDAPGKLRGEVYIYRIQRAKDIIVACAHVGIEQRPVTLLVKDHIHGPLPSLSMMISISDKVKPLSEASFN